MGLSAEAAAQRPQREAHVRSSATGAEFDPVLSFEKWSELGVKMARAANGALWWLGDWLLFGRERYGRRYRVAVEATGLDAQTLRNYASVARRFERGRRRAALSFQHHAVLCPLSDEDQDRWLDRAEDGNWSRNELRRHLRAHAQRENRDEATPVSLRAPGDALDRWRRAAEHEELGLEEWIIRTLNEAAGAIAKARAGRANLVGRIAVGPAATEEVSVGVGTA